MSDEYERYSRCLTLMDLAFLSPSQAIYISNESGQFDLWLQDLTASGETGAKRALTAFTGQRVWLAEGNPVAGVAYAMVDEGGRGLYQIISVNPRDGQLATITSNAEARHYLAHGSVDPTGRRLMYCDNERDPADFDVVIQDLPSGSRTTPLARGHHWEWPMWEPSGRAVSANMLPGPDEVHGFVHLLRTGQTVEILPHVSKDAVEIVGWSSDGRRVLVIHNLETDIARLEMVDWLTGKRRPLFGGDHDVEFARVLPGCDLVLFGVNRDGYTEIYLGPERGPFGRVRRVPPGCVTRGYGAMIACSPDASAILIGWSTGTTPPEILWVPLPRGKPRQVTSSLPSATGAGPLVPPRLVRIRADDGRRIGAFYYLPTELRGHRIPAVLVIHGGPSSQERPSWGFFGLYAYLNSCGVAVLAPNIRGSTGYGKEFRSLVHHDWGGGDLADARACADWLRSRREIDGVRLGIFGGSYGGFLALSCATRLPDYWAACVDWCGPSNLVTFVETAPPFLRRFLIESVGDPERERDFLEGRSPVSYIDQLRAPLLVIQGANDRRVPPEESRRIVERARALGHYVEYELFPDEGHSFGKAANIIAATSLTARFLVTHLKSKV